MTLFGPSFHPLFDPSSSIPNFELIQLPFNFFTEPSPVVAKQALVLAEMVAPQLSQNGFCLGAASPGVSTSGPANPRQAALRACTRFRLGSDGLKSSRCIYVCIVLGAASHLYACHTFLICEKCLRRCFVCAYLFIRRRKERGGGNHSTGWLAIRPPGSSNDSTDSDRRVKKETMIEHGNSLGCRSIFAFPCARPQP